MSLAKDVLMDLINNYEKFFLKKEDPKLLEKIKHDIYGQLDMFLKQDFTCYHKDELVTREEHEKNMNDKFWIDLSNYNLDKYLKNPIVVKDYNFESVVGLAEIRDGKLLLIVYKGKTRLSKNGYEGIGFICDDNNNLLALSVNYKQEDRTCLIS